MEKSSKNPLQTESILQDGVLHSKKQQAKGTDMSLNLLWIGKEGAAFERVGLAFQACGYLPPTPDTNADGAYAMNIAEQYRADMSRGQALAVINCGLSHPREYFIGTKLSLRDVAASYAVD